MLRFRAPPSQPATASPADLFAVSQIIDDAMQPGNFFAAPELGLSWTAARSETIRWEIFRGRLVDETQTRETRTFLSWHVVPKPACDEGAGGVEPAQAPASPAGLLSVKLDVHERRIHVTRGILCHAWEGYDTGGGVIDSREIVKWTHELVGTIALDEYANLDDVRDEFICLVWQAIVGTSRLPLTSLEAPLPAFTFGQLHYLYQEEAGEQTHTSWEAWLRRGLQASCTRHETIKLVEFTLRHIQGAIAEIHRIVEVFGKERPVQIEGADAVIEELGWPVRGEPVGRLMRALFNDVSLSPQTPFAGNALALGFIWGGMEFLSHLLRQLCRHLTAYDLVVFHHRGANYPDALLLDTALNYFAKSMAVAPSFSKGKDTKSRQRRRALRHACLTRRQYEGHLVPDAPTSPGENARVMPASHPRVPEEQLTQTRRRHRQLFADEPLSALLSPEVRKLLGQSVRDLKRLEERVEMGTALFIDRPLGYGKTVGAPDQTPLLAHEAFSPSIARRRWGEMKNLCEELAIPCDAKTLDELFANGPWPTGLPHQELAECPRPVAALADVRRVADDFVILRTLPVGLADCLRHFDWRPLLARYRLQFLAAGDVRWCVQASGGTLILGDMEGRRRLELHVDISQGYRSRAGVELPRAGLQALAVWEDGELVRQDLAVPWTVPIAT